MIERLSKYMAAVAVCAALAGCNDGLQGPDVPTGAGMVTITLKNSNATRSAESDNSETLIKNVVVALYPREYGENRRAVALQRFEGIDKNNSTTVQMKLTDDMVQTLFGGTSGADCNLFAVANVDLSGIPDNATIADLKNIVATSRFNELKVQESFVMAGSGTVRYSQAGGVESATGRGDLVRAAAKISLNIKLPASVTDADGAEWVPAISSTGGVRAILSNGVKTSVAAPGEDWQPVEDGYYSLTMRNAGLVRELPNSGDGSEYPYHIDVPFYTYPNQWEETPEEQHKTMMTLVVPWQKRGETQWNTYYYQVPVTNLTNIVSNYSYVVNLNVGMLGSLSPETPETLEDLSYQIVDWGKEDINVDIKDTRYLVVSPKEITIDNEAEFSIPYYSSHPIKVTNIEMNYKRYNYYSDGNGDVVTINVSNEQIKKSCVIQGNDTTQRLCTAKVAQDELGQTVLKVNHPLKVWLPYKANDEVVELTGRSKNSTNDSPESVNKTISKYQPASPEENAYSPYEIKVTIAHTDNEAFTETITITQYPGMYIVNKLNPGGGTNNYPGNVFVNNSSSSLGGVHSLPGNNTNSNPNMYVINISTLDSDSKYIIGDPRMPYSNNDLSTYQKTYEGWYGWGDRYGYPDLPMPTSNGVVAGTWCNEAPVLYPTGSSTSRRLTYYYPTIESQDNQYKMMVAPKIRVASSYGKTEELNRDNARRRIATYQERECAAGRWRLPTYGELQFIISLSSTKKIPVLFTIGSTYWTAQGPCRVNSDGTITQVASTYYEYGTYFVRGVYDEWYWEKEKDFILPPNDNGNFTYTLGDMPRK